MTVNIKVTFTSGIGHLNSRLFQAGTGIAIASGSVSVSGTITYNNAGPGDVIEIDGVCTGNCSIAMSKPTTASTPVIYPSGNIFDSFTVN